MRRLFFAVPILMLAAPLAAQEIPAHVEPLLTCGHVFSLHSMDAGEAGDPDTEAEFFNMGDALLWQAQVALQEAGFAEAVIQDVLLNSGITVGFRYGGGEKQALLADCLAGWDSP